MFLLFIILIFGEKMIQIAANTIMLERRKINFVISSEDYTPHINNQYARY